MPCTVTNNEKSILTAEEVCCILESCRTAKVAVLEFRDLYVKFGAEPVPAPEPQVAMLDPLTPDKEISAAQEVEAVEALRRDEMKMRLDQLHQMFIEDPVQAEQLLRDGVIEVKEDDESSEDA